MTFGAPHWLWALALLPALLALYLWNEQRRSQLLAKLVAARLLEDLAASVSAGRRRLRLLATLAGLACVIVAMARPQLGYTWQETKRKGRDVLIAIDTSKSMLAGDLPPDRLTRAKLAAQDLLDLLPGDRLGLIAFAGDAFLQAPLTIDYSAVLSSIDELDVEIIPRGGTNIAAAIRIAAEAFGKGESDNRALILMSDGEELDADAVKAARQHAKEFRIFCVGIGSREGALIPVRGEQGGTTFVKDASGQFVKSTLDESRLQEIASASGGFYLGLQNAPDAMKQIVARGLGQMQERDIDARTSREPIERYQWPLAAGLLFLMASLLVGERKRARRMATALAAGLAMLPWSGEAANRGVELYEKGNYQEALQAFQNQLTRRPKNEALHFDAGTAAYKLGDYDHALEAFAKAVTSPEPELRAQAEYNLGNTLFQRGLKREEKEARLREWRNALQHYDEALKAEPQHADARANRETVRKLIEELEKEPPPQEQKKDEPKDQPDQEKDKQQQSAKNDQPKQEPSPSRDQSSKESNPEDSKSGSDEKKEGSKEQKEQEKNAKSEPKEGEGKSQDKPPEKDQSGDQKKEEKEKGDQGQAQSDQSKPSSQKGQEQAAASPVPVPSPGGEKPSGEIKAQPSEEKKPAGEQPAEVAEVKPGEMSEAQARALIESLRGEDQRVQLNERPATTEVLKDW